MPPKPMTVMTVPLNDKDSVAIELDDGGEPPVQRTLIAQGIEAQFDDSPGQLYLNFLNTVRANSNTISLTLADFAITLLTAGAIYLALLSAMPYVKPSGDLARAAGADPEKYVTSSFDLNAVLNTFGLKSGFSLIALSIAHAMQNLFCSTSRSHAELSFEYEKTWSFYFGKVVRNLGSAFAIAIFTVIANMPSLAIAFKENKEIVIPENSGLWPPSLAAYLNSLDGGSAELQYAAIFIANYFLMLIPVMSMYFKSMASSLVTRFTKSKNPTELAMHHIRQKADEMSAAMQKSVVEFQQAVFLQVQTKVTPDIQTFFTLLQSKTPTTVETIEMRLLMAKIVNDAPSQPTPRIQKQNKYYDMTVTAFVLALLSWQSYLMLPATSPVDPSTSPMNQPVDPMIQPPAARHPILLPLLFITLAGTLGLVFLREIYHSIFNWPTKPRSKELDRTGEDVFRNLINNFMSRMVILGSAGIIIGTREMATWTMNTFWIPAKANDFPSYCLGMGLAFPFTYLGLMAGESAAETVSDFLIGLSRHYRARPTPPLGEEWTFMQKLKMFFLHWSTVLKTVRLPEIFILHPFIAPILMLIIFIYAPYSAGTARQLNREQFGDDVATYLLLIPTVITITLFNLLGVPVTMSEFFRFATRILLQISDLASAAVHTIRNTAPSALPQPAPVGCLPVVWNACTNYQITRNLYCLMGFNETLIASTKRMDAINLYLNMFVYLFSLQLKKLSPDHLAGELLRFRTRLLRDMAQVSPDKIDGIMQGILERKDQLPNAPDELRKCEVKLEKMLAFYFSNVPPEKLASDPKYYQGRTYSGFFGKIYSDGCNLMEPETKQRTHSANSDDFWPDLGASGRYGAISWQSANRLLGGSIDDDENSSLLANQK